MLKVLKLIDELSQLRRWGHSHCNKPESVLEHTGFVSVYALALAYKYEADLATVLEYAIVHDMEEVIVGDIPTPTKYDNKGITEQINLISDRAAMEISDDVLFGKMYSPWKNSKSNTLEGSIIRIADSAAVVYKIKQEVESGNKYFKKYIGNISNSLLELESDISIGLQIEVRNLIRIVGQIR